MRGSNLIINVKSAGKRRILASGAALKRTCDDILPLQPSLKEKRDEKTRKKVKDNQLYRQSLALKQSLSCNVWRVIYRSSSIANYR